MKANEIINENWVQLAKAVAMLSNSSKFKHLPNETIQKMAHKVVDKWNNPVVKTAPKKPHTVQDLTKQYRKDKLDMNSEEFKSHYGFSKPTKR